LGGGGAGGQNPLVSVDPGDGIVLAFGDIQEAAVATQGIENAAHGTAFVGIVDVEDMVNLSIGAGVFFGRQIAGLFEQADELPLQQGPVGWGIDLGCFDRG